MLTLKEVYTKVRDHLLKQNRNSVAYTSDRGLRCAYRGEQGTACAVGCLIADEHYTPIVEGIGVASLNRLSAGVSHKVDSLRNALKRSGVDIDDVKTCDMLGELQRLHDAGLPGAWPGELAYIAVTYGVE